MEPKWYSIKQTTSLESKIEVQNITLTIHKFNDMLRTKAMLHEYRKCSIFQVPDSQFRLKLIFSGTENEVMEIYYTTNSTIFMRHEFKVSMSDYTYTDHNCRFMSWSKIFTKTYEIRDFCKVLANKWQHCGVLLETTGSRHKRLELIIVFTISREVIADHGVPQTNAQKQLGDDFGILLTDGSYSDVTIKSAEGVEFKVHKNILAIRSAVLKAHFDHNMRESTTNTVETTWETDVLRDVLNYVYTGTAPRVDNDPDKLLAAADYYQLEGLKVLCGTALYKRLTVENAIETLELAEQFSAKKLLDDTLAFIRDGPVRMIINTEGWSKIQSTSILKKLYEVIMADGHDNTEYIFEEAYKELGEEFFNN